MRKKINPRLFDRLETERFVLAPVGIIGAIRLYLRSNDDEEILRQLTHNNKPLSWNQWRRRAKLPNRRSRFVYDIIDKETGKSIGYHKLQNVKLKSAELSVVIYDRNWWGKTVPIEVRKRLIPHFSKHADIGRFYGYVEARNFASISNYQRLGFKHCGTFHRTKYDAIGEKFVDYLYFELLKEDFPDYAKVGSHE